MVKNLINEGRVNHTGETMLAEHVGRAVAVKTPGAIALSSQKSSGPIESMCLATAHCQIPSSHTVRLQAEKTIDHRSQCTDCNLYYNSGMAQIV